MPDSCRLPAKLDDRDWASLTVGQHIYGIEVDGYTVVPDLLDCDLIARLKQQAALLESRAVDYSVHQQVCSDLQFVGGAITELIAHAATIKLLRVLFGDEIIFMTYSYARSEPGHPGISLHTDGQPYGSRIFGFEGSVPHMVRVLYYLDDLTPLVSPFRVVPGSHLSLHADANPYRRYESHPQEVHVCAKAGSAVFLNHRVFHGNCPNTGDQSREMLAIAYRPAWAGPVGDLPAWRAEDLDRLPENVRSLFRDRNTRHWDFGGGNKPADMPADAPGINPDRWDT